MRKNLPESIADEKRAEARAMRFQNYRIEIKLVGTPIYQFRVNDISTKGAGLLISESSGFLKMIEVGQTVEANFISPNGSDPSGMYRVEIRHITKTEESRYKGFRLVGISIRDRLDPS
jgi:hypothetical protein